MRNKMLNYTQSILEKVSFDRDLFLKEVQKAKGMLQVQEWLALVEWLREFVNDKPLLKYELYARPSLIAV
ncbi:MAG: hypothetical protein O3C00_04330 [Bacteroidetes bacterium]|nr:hypothetical protein [Bacteroidota bacterium]